MPDEKPGRSRFFLVNCPSLIFRYRETQDRSCKMPLAGEVPNQGSGGMILPPIHGWDVASYIVGEFQKRLLNERWKRVWRLDVQYVIIALRRCDLLRRLHKLRFWGDKDFRGKAKRRRFLFSDVEGYFESREPRQGTLERTEKKRFNDLAFQENILFF